MTLVWAALALGAVYVIVALGFNMVMASTGLFNFAAPQFIAVGALIGYQVSRSTDVWYAVLLVALASALISGILGYVEERVAVRPLLKKNSHSGILITTVGFAVITEGVLFATWGSDPRPYTFGNLGQTLQVAGGGMQYVDIVLFALAGALAFGLILVSKRTRWGLSGRAATSDPDAARLKGVDAKRVGIVAFVSSSAVLGASGVLIGIKLQASYLLGTELLLIGFVALAVGGFGSYLGSLIGGLTIGVMQMGATFFLGSEYQLIIVYLVLVAVLLLKPTGILGSRGARHV